MIYLQIFLKTAQKNLWLIIQFPSFHLFHFTENIIASAKILKLIIGRRVIISVPPNVVPAAISIFVQGSQNVRQMAFGHSSLYTYTPIGMYDLH